VHHGERHPGHLLGRPRRALCLNPSTPALPRDGTPRRGRRCCRSGPDAQLPAAPWSDRRRGASGPRREGTRQH
jgi:hypothetical protein